MENGSRERRKAPTENVSWTEIPSEAASPKADEEVRVCGRCYGERVPSLVPRDPCSLGPDLPRPRTSCPSGPAKQDLAKAMSVLRAHRKIRNTSRPRALAYLTPRQAPKV